MGQGKLLDKPNSGLLFISVIASLISLHVDDEAHHQGDGKSEGVFSHPVFKFGAPDAKERILILC